MDIFLLAFLMETWKVFVLKLKSWRFQGASCCFGNHIFAFKQAKSVCQQVGIFCTTWAFDMDIQMCIIHRYMHVCSSTHAGMHVCLKYACTSVCRDGWIDVCIGNCTAGLGYPNFYKSETSNLRFLLEDSEDASTCTLMHLQGNVSLF